MPKLMLVDMQYVLQAVSSLLNPSITQTSTHNASAKPHYIGVGEHGRSGSVSAADKCTLRVANELQHVAAFIGKLGSATHCLNRLWSSYDRTWFSGPDKQEMYS
jgi:hypothetical protein